MLKQLSSEPLGLEALGAAGLFPFCFLSGLAFCLQADANKWKSREQGVANSHRLWCRSHPR